MSSLVRVPFTSVASVIATVHVLVGAGTAHSETTVFSTPWVEMWVITTDENSVIDTGSLIARDELGYGLVAEAIGTDYCGNLTINVTGNIVSGADGVRSLACGQSTINVLPGTSMTRTSSGWPTIRNTGRHVTTNIDGTVMALTPSDFLLDSWVGDFPADNPTGTSALNLGSSARLSGWIHMSVGADRVTINPGAEWTTANINRFGEGYDSLTNAGTIFAQAGAGFKDLEKFENLGTIDLSDGMTATMNIDGDYFGGSGTVRMEVSGALADRLMIVGAATGSSTVDVNFLTEGVFSSSGILLIDAGASSADAFRLGSVTGNVSTLVDYTLTQNGSDYILFATPNEGGMRPLSLSVVAADLSHESAEVLFKGMVKVPRVRRKQPFAFWNAPRGGSERVAALRSPASDTPDGTANLGSQFGAEMFVGQEVAVGVTGSYGSANANRRLLSKGVQGGSSNYGLYAHYESKSGFYATALLKKDRENLQLTDSAFRATNGVGSSLGLALGGGHRAQRGSVRVDVATSLAFLQTQIDGFSAEGINYRFGKSNSLRGRVGTRLNFDGPLAPFIDAEVHHEFAQGKGVTLTSGPASFSAKSDEENTWGRLELGFGSQLQPGPTFSAWGQLGKAEAVGLRAGIRL